MANAQQSEADLWQQNIDSLRWAVTLRKPDAIARLKLQVDRLDKEISALMRRWSFASGGMASVLNTRIEILTDRMEDLRSIGDLVRSSPLDHDDGVNPEAAARAGQVWDGEGNLRGFKSQDPGIEDLNDDLKRAAMDIRSGWLVVTKGAAYAISGKSPGTLTVGNRAEALRKQYLAFIPELHRKRMGTWALDDVVCEGLSRAECSQKRRCRIEQVYDQLVTGLNLYAETYPPLSDGEV